MRILIDALAATAGGGGRTRVRELARTLPRLAPQHEYVFAVSADNVGAVRELAPNLEVVTPPARSSSLLSRIVFEHTVLPWIAATRRVEVVLAPFNIAPVVWPGRRRPWIGVIVSNLCPYSDIVVSRYRGTGRARLHALRWMTDRTLRHADRVFLLSEQAYSLVDPVLLRNKAELIPMAPPTPDFGESAESGGDRARPYMLVAADLMRFKGIELIPGALARIERSRRPDLLICGRPLEPDYVASVKEEARRLGVSDRMQFLGSVPHPEVLGLMRRARACLFPSRFENLSRVPVEAMSIGTPVIASDVPSSREACGDAALYFAIDDPSAISRCVERILEDGELRERLTAAGHRRLASMKTTDASQRILRSLETIRA